MKKLILSFTAVSFIAFGASAQITLNQSSFSSAQIMGLDSLMMTTLTSPYPNLHPATNATWDMSNLTYVNNIDSQYRVASSGSAQYADSEALQFANFIYYTNVQSSVTNTGIIHYGEDVKRQPFHISAPSTQPTDSLVIDAQDFLYSSPEIEVQFPATLSSSWSSNFQYDFHFHLTLAAFFLNNTPGFVRSIMSRKDSVVGWGQMRVKNAAGNVSNYYNVLQIESRETLTDSFFLNGQPAPGALLSAFSVTQGQTSTNYAQYYYRSQDITPLATVYYDNGINSSPTAAETQAQRLETGVANVPFNNNIRVYPNPVINNTINIDVPKTVSGNWNYELINVSGQTVSSSTLNLGNQTHTQITVHQKLTPGIYYLRLKDQEGDILVRPLDVTK